MFPYLEMAKVTASLPQDVVHITLAQLHLYWEDRMGTKAFICCFSYNQNGMQTFTVLLMQGVNQIVKHGHEKERENHNLLVDQ